MRKIIHIILTAAFMAAMAACQTDDEDNRLTADDGLPTQTDGTDSRFDATWITDPNSNGLLPTAVRMTADSIFIEPMPDEQILIEAFGYAEAMRTSVIEAPVYGMRYVPLGYSETTTVYRLDADDYRLLVETGDGQRHTLTVRFTFDCQMSVNSYTNALTLWLKMKAIYVDNEPVDNDRISGWTFLLFV